jgi:3-dehydroquinate synthetase
MLGNYNEGNILFCDDLYNKNGLDIVEYLSLQKQALDRADNNDKYSSSKNQLIAVLCIQQKPLRDSYKENIDALLETKNAEKVMLPAVKDAKVKSLLEIQELYRHLFRTAPKTKAKIDEIVIKAAKSGIVLSMVQRLLDQDDLERVYKPDVQELTTWLRELGYTRNNNENKIEKAKDILSDYNLDTATKRSLVIKLQNYYNKNVRDKKAGN